MTADSCETTHAWRSLLSSLRGPIPKECPFEDDAARDVAQGIRAVAARNRYAHQAGARARAAGSGPPMFRQLLGEIGADD